MVDNKKIVVRKYVEAIGNLEGIRVDDPEDYHLLVLRRAEHRLADGCWSCRVRLWHVRRSVGLSRWWVAFCIRHTWPAIWAIVVVLIPATWLIKTSAKVFTWLAPCTARCKNNNRRDEKGGT